MTSADVLTLCYALYTLITAFINTQERFSAPYMNEDTECSHKKKKTL